MVLPRPSSRWSISLRRHPIRTFRELVRCRTCQRVQKRSYASAEGGTQQVKSKLLSGDLPWAIASITISVPSIYYLAQPQLKKKPHNEGHGHDGRGNHEEHDEGSTGDAEESSGSPEENKEGESEAEEKSEGDAEESSGSPQENKEGESEGEEKSQGDKIEEGGEASDRSFGAGVEEGKDRPATSDFDEERTSDQKPPGEVAGKTIKAQKESTSEGVDDIEGVQFKGASNQTEAGTQSHTAKIIPDAKGYNKKRLESHYGNRLGVAEDEEQQPENKDTGASSKAAGKKSTTMSGKQEGLDNTDTKHSTDLTKNPEKSKKVDGMPETAKSKGTVDPSKPLRGPNSS